MVVDLNGDLINDEKKTITQAVGITLQKHTHKFTNYVTKNICQKRGESTDKNKIVNFIKRYDINWKKAIKCKNTKTVEECAKKFKTLNDFFIRKIYDEKKLIDYLSNSPKTFGSPADSRTLYLYNEKYAKKVWVKGTNYCVKCMLGISNNKEVSEYYNKSHILISRLAHVDYHRFHSPVDGVFIGYYNIPGSYLSVDPKLINSKKNVLTLNNRSVYFISTKYFGIIALCIVGACCVGSIKVHNHRVGYKIQKGEEIGNFNFGGSTIVTVIPNNKNMEVIPELKKNNKKETYVTVGTKLIASNQQCKIYENVKKEMMKMIKINKKKK